MKWILLSQANPAALHACLASAEIGAARKPEIILTDTQLEHYPGYSLVAERFRHARWTLMSDFRAELLNLINAPRKNGSVEPMLAFTTDTMLFRHNRVFHGIWEILQNQNILGVSLTLCARQAGPSLVAEKFSGQDAHVYTWQWPNVEGNWGEGFSYGTVYRTSDLLGPLWRKEWDSPGTLQEALNNDVALRRRTKMACFAESPLLYFDAPPPYRYLQGEVLDVPALRQGKTEWTLYQPEESNG